MFYPCRIGEAKHPDDCTLTAVRAHDNGRKSIPGNLSSYQMFAH